MVSSVTRAFTPRTLSLGVPKLRVYQDNPQAVIELKEAIGKQISSFGSKVTKAVIDRRKKRTQDCNQSGCHQFKKCFTRELLG